MSNAATRAETRIQTIEGGITAPAGFKAAGVYAGIKPPTHAWPLDVMVLTADQRLCRPPPSSRRTRRRRRPCSSRARTSSSRAAARRRSSATAAAPTPAPATRAWRWPARRSNSSPGMSDAGPKRCSSPRPASSASISTCRRSQDGVTKALAVLSRERASQRHARDHDDRSVSEGSGGESGHAGRDVSTSAA